MRVTAETKSATRERILDAAKKLFAQEGFEAATTRDIARAAKIAAGTLFNYFSTKDAIALSLIGEAHAKATESFHPAATAEPPLALEEELFAHVAAGLRTLKPYRKYLPAVLETSLSPLAAERNGDEPSLRAVHLETVSRIVSNHGCDDALSSIALHLYWTLYCGVLVFWAKDSSPRQEDTLALVDQSLGMFARWLTGQDHYESRRSGG